MHVAVMNLAVVHPSAVLAGVQYYLHAGCLYAELGRPALHAAAISSRSAYHHQPGSAAVQAPGIAGPVCDCMLPASTAVHVLSAFLAGAGQ